MGRTLSTLFTKYNPKVPDQSKLNRTAVGHYANYQTHALTGEEKDTPLDLLESVCSWKQFQEDKTKSWNLGKVALTRKELIDKKDQRNNPYYNVAVDDVIISGHNEIWGDQFRNFLYRFVAVQNADDRECFKTGEKH